MDNLNPPLLDRDAQIRAEVSRIQAEHPAAQGYRPQLRALLAALFFKFGERPGANRLIALLSQEGRSPSTSTAQDEINKFWENLRQQAQIQLHRPDVPQPVLDLFGDVASTVWELSVSQALQTFESQRQDTVRQIAEAVAAETLVRFELAEAHSREKTTAEELVRMQGYVERLAQQVLDEEAVRKEAEARLATVTEQLARAEARLASESARVEEVRTDMATALAQAAKEQQRLMLASDDFKQAAARDRAMLTRTEAARDQLQAENDQLRQTVTDLAGEKGLFSGRIAEQEKQITQLLADSGRPANASQTTIRIKARRPGLRIRTR